MESLYPPSLQDPNISDHPKALFRRAFPGSNSAQLSHQPRPNAMVPQNFTIDNAKTGENDITSECPI